MRLLTFLSLIALLVSCKGERPKVEDLRDPSTLRREAARDEYTAPIEKPDLSEKSSVLAPSNWSYKVTSISENNWGYQLFDGSKMVINQTSIPSVQGIDGFDTREKAERTAKFIVQKLERGVFPPTVDKKELDSLGVLRN